MTDVECDGECTPRYPAKIIDTLNHFEILKIELSYAEEEKLAEVFEAANIPLRVEM